MFNFFTYHSGYLTYQFVFSRSSHHQIQVTIKRKMMNNFVVYSLRDRDRYLTLYHGFLEIFLPS